MRKKKQQQQLLLLLLIPLRSSAVPREDGPWAVGLPSRIGIRNLVLNQKLLPLDLDRKVLGEENRFLLDPVPKSLSRLLKILFLQLLKILLRLLPRHPLKIFIRVPSYLKILFLLLLIVLPFPRNALKLILTCLKTDQWKWPKSEIWRKRALDVVERRYLVQRTMAVPHLFPRG